jgi:hypothetical protein
MDQINRDGYLIKRGLLSYGECSEILEDLSKIKTDLKIPFTNIQWGYGNLVDHPLADHIKNNPFIKEFCKNFKYRHLFVHNKVRWVGPDIEWHQEVFNIDSFHPIKEKLSVEEIKSNFLQVYIALEKQNIGNGGLKIIPKSHEEGILKHYDTLNTHLNHKRAVLPSELDRIYKKYGIVNLDLNPGDVVIFNHLLVHGSTSNNSPFDRKAMVFLLYKDQHSLDEKVKEKEKKYRKEFVKKSLSDKLA